MDAKTRIKAFLDNPAVKRARGKKELGRYALEGRALTQRQAIYAKRYDCMGGYSDGKHSCGVAACPLSPWMPYRDTPHPGDNGAVPEDG